MAKIRIRFTITSGNLETAFNFDCQKWISHIAANRVKSDELLTIYNGKFPTSRLFVLDMLEFLRTKDQHLDNFLLARGGIKQDDLLSIENDDVRQLLNREFPELVAEFANSETVKKVIKRRPGKVDLSPLVDDREKR
jgi:hypothetical protein